MMRTGEIHYIRLMELQKREVTFAGKMSDMTSLFTLVVVISFRSRQEKQLLPLMRNSLQTFCSKFKVFVVQTLKKKRFLVMTTHFGSCSAVESVC